MPILFLNKLYTNAHLYLYLIINMKKFSFKGKHISLLLAVFVAIGIAVPHQAHALPSLGDLVLFVPGYIMSYIVMPIMALLVYLSGMILNWSMDYSVVHMQIHYGEAGLDTIWSVLRDLANMGFIFILLYTAILTIFGQSNWQKTIRNVVIVALLINFSLFITKAVIDASNVLALLFYNAIAPGVSTGAAATTGIASSFMNILGLQSLYALAGVSGTRLVIAGAAGTVIYLIASFTFLTIAVMFVIRFVVLLFVVVLSPIACIAMILPNGTKLVNDWKSALVGQAFFAPVYFALTWVALKVSQSLLDNGGKMDWGPAILGNNPGGGNVWKASPGAVGTFVLFAIIITLLLASLKAAKDFAAKSPGALNKLTGQAIAGASGLVYGKAVGGLGRSQIGSRGARMAEDPDLIKRTQAPGMAGAMARLQLAGAKRAANATFDPRNASLPGKFLVEGARTIEGGIRDTELIKNKFGGALKGTAVGKKLGLDTFDVGAHGARVQRFVDKIPDSNFGAKIGDKIGTGKGGTDTYKSESKADKEKDREFQKDRAAEIKKAENKTAMKDGIEASKKPAGTRTPAEEDSIKELVKVIKDMSDKEIEEQKHSTLAIQEVAESLSAKQLEKVLGSTDKFTDVERAEIFEKHFAPLTEAIQNLTTGFVGTGPGATAVTPAQKAEYESRIKNTSDKELEMLPAESFDTTNPRTEPHATTLIKTLSQGQIDTLTKSSNNKLLSSEKQAIKDSRAKPLKDSFTAGRWSDAVSSMEKMGEPALAKLPTGVSPDVPSLDNEKILHLYTPAILNKLAAQTDLNATKRNAIRTAITDKLNTPAMAGAAAALAALQATPPPDRAQRQVILSALTPEEKKLVQSADWLESENGQQIF
jgi:hypothetical protein